MERFWDCHFETEVVTGSSRTRSSQRGAVLVEQSYALLIFTMMFVASFDVVRILYFVLAGQHAVTRATQWGAVGERIGKLSREDSIKVKVAEYAKPFSIPIKNEQIKICPVSDPNCVTENAGAANQFYVVRFNMPISGMILKANSTITLWSFARNEGF